MLSATHHIPSLTLIDHTFSVPLDHARPEGERIEVYAREVAAPGRTSDGRPWLVFFQGGPGGKSPRPLGATGWVGRALKDYRVLLLDQRGTGRSTPVTAQTLAWRGDAQAQADYLKHFRADAIVRDAERIRATLLGPGERWSVLGQSFGGFCVTTYLSLAPEGLREAFITGGLAPVAHGPDDVYRATYRRVLAKNRLYFGRYPEDRERAAAILAHLASNEVTLADGSRLSPRRFQQLGIAFGMSDGYEQVHYLLEEAFVSGPEGLELGAAFLHGVLAAVSFAARPIYAILQEPCYCEGIASRWSAERIRAEFPEFAPEPGAAPLFTGEMIYPWMFKEDRELRPLREAAEILADYDGWPTLYDVERLRANTVPVAAAVYYDDMYVERAFSEETAALIPGCRLWATNEYEHNGLRLAGEAVLGRLIALARGEA
jgi:pimeloyl-ACP methyl ester carboxylesterase